MGFIPIANLRPKGQRKNVSYCFDIGCHLKLFCLCFEQFYAIKNIVVHVVKINISDKIRFSCLNYCILPLSIARMTTL